MISATRQLFFFVRIEKILQILQIDWWLQSMYLKGQKCMYLSCKNNVFAFNIKLDNYPVLCGHPLVYLNSGKPVRDRVEETF